MKHKKYIFLLGLLFLWEYLGKNNLINVFLLSYPSNILKTLLHTKDLPLHIGYTLYELIISSSIGYLLSFLLALLNYFYPKLSNHLDSFLNKINAIPKVALAPLLILIIGATLKTTILMGILINVITTYTVLYTGFKQVDKDYLKLLHIYKGTKIQEIKYILLPACQINLIDALKTNIAMSFIGIITGELLVSKYGLGYLINYGTQVFNMNLLLGSIICIILLASLLYEILNYIEKRLTH